MPFLVPCLILVHILILITAMTTRSAALIISMQTLTSESWPMFTFGFGAVFAFTQLPGLPCLQRQHWALRCVPMVIFIAVVVVTYVSVTKWTKPHVVVFIPAAEYLGAMALNVILYAGIRLSRNCGGSSGGSSGGKENGM